MDWKRQSSSQILDVVADRGAVEQALGNLMRNSIQALEALPEAGVRKISWNLGRAESGRAWVKIEDSGPGISAQIRSRLFSPFSTTKAQGTGLGLSWVKRVIEEQGGEVQVHDQGSRISDAQPGASFSLVFASSPPESLPNCEAQLI